MPLYMDLHKGLSGVKRKDVEHAHQQDVLVQDKFGVKYHKFWVNEEEGTIFCLVEGPNKDACIACHHEAHGLLPCEIIEVKPSDVAVMMGATSTEPTGLVVHPDGKIDSAVRTFLFTDIVNSTSLTELYGDIVSMTILRKHNEIVREHLQKHAGTEVKHTGDGIMAAFMSSSKAIHCSLETQESLRKYREQHPEIPLHIRIGINAGEPVTEGDDFFGAAVQLAKRICDYAPADQVLISEVVKSLCLGRHFEFTDLGEHNLKGFTLPVKLFAVLS
jgi:class 3 adenylate cyclase